MGKFSENLRRIMAERNMNQVELAKKTGILQPLISNYLTESPKAKTPSLRNLVKLAAALQVSIEELTGRNSDMPQVEKAALERFANNLRRLMKARGLNQQELTDRSGVPQSNISRYLNANYAPRLHHILALAKALHVGIGDLTGDPEHTAAEKCAEELTSVTPDELALLDAYKNMSEEQKRAIETILLGWQKID